MTTINTQIVITHYHIISTERSMIIHTVLIKERAQKALASSVQP